jgi:hypothetical protein
MLTLVIIEINHLIQDEKSPSTVAVGCIAEASFNASKFTQSTDLGDELRALQCIVITIGFVVFCTTKNIRPKAKTHESYGAMKVSS